MRKKKNKKPNQLESKVLKIHQLIRSDEHGRYLAYCDFNYHQGIIINEEICQVRHCDHYYKLYIKRK
jgi:hypothetical protein